MMNIFAIFLVLTTTLVTAGVEEDVIVKEGHRVVVVEYEPNDAKTKVSFSPPQQTTTGEYVKNKLSDAAEEVKDKIKETISSSQGQDHRVHSARELVCDAYGKCKHRIASALEGTKDTVSEKAHDTKEVVENAFEKVKEKGSDVKEKAKDKASEKYDQVKESAKATGETLKGDLKRNATEDLDIIEEKAKEAKDSVIEDAKRLKVEGKRDYKEMHKFFSDVLAYVFSAKNMRSLMGMIHLLGFALSYGVCIWVTFISSHLLVRSLPKQQFSMVQSKIYPVYFKTMAYGVLATFLGHFLSQKHRYYANWAETIQGVILLTTFSMTMVNCHYLEPRATKVMTERIKLEKEEGKGKDVFSVEPSTSSVDALKDPTGAKTGEQVTTGETTESRHELTAEETRMKPQVERLSRKLKKLNAISSFFNVMTLTALSYHLIYLSQLVHATSY